MNTGGRGERQGHLVGRLRLSSRDDGWPEPGVADVCCARLEVELLRIRAQASDGNVGAKGEILMSGRRLGLVSDGELRPPPLASIIRTFLHQKNRQQANGGKRQGPCMIGDETSHCQPSTATPQKSPSRFLFVDVDEFDTEMRVLFL